MALRRPWPLAKVSDFIMVRESLATRSVISVRLLRSHVVEGPVLNEGDWCMMWLLVRVKGPSPFLNGLRGILWFQR